MSANPGWYDSSNVLLTAPLSITGTGGTPGAAVEFRLINNKGGVGADAITNARLLLLVRDAGSSGAFVVANHEVVDRYMLEVKVTGGYQVTLTPTDWRKVGAGRLFDGIPAAVANDTGVIFNIRVNAPADVGAVSVEFQLALVDDRGNVLGAGVSVAGTDGIYCGIGDANVSALIVASNVTQDGGGPTSDVAVPLLVGVGAGVPWTLRAHTESISASSSGHSRYVLLSIDLTGAMVNTSGAEVTGALTDADKPATPTGNLPICYLAVDHTDAISNADITNVWALGFFASAPTGLVVAISSGPYAFVDNALVYASGSSNVTLAASSTLWLWLLASGEFQTTTAEVSPDGKALPLYKYTTDGSTVTSTTDLRFLVGRDRAFLLFRWDGNVANGSRYAHLPSGRTAYFSPLHAFSISIGALGDGNGGALSFDVLDDSATPGTFVSTFATSADRPQIAHGATVLVAQAIAPDRFNLARFARVKATVTIPTGGSTPPSDALLVAEVFL